MREIKFTNNAWLDYVWWQGQDRKTLKRINGLIEAARLDSFVGLGKPEPLVGNLSGYWSRRIDDTHRLVYAVEGDAVVVVGCRYDYGP